jgi:hypothetical protein
MKSRAPYKFFLQPSCFFILNELCSKCTLTSFLTLAYLLSGAFKKQYMYLFHLSIPWCGSPSDDGYEGRL